MKAETKELQLLHDNLSRGDCCAAALVRLALEMRKEGNEQLISTVTALCGGVQDGLLCGALTGGAIMLNILSPGPQSQERVAELSRWFVSAMGQEFGGTDCRKILDGSPLNKASRCPRLIEAVLQKVLETLDDASD